MSAILQADGRKHTQSKMIMKYSNELGADIPNRTQGTLAFPCGGAAYTVARRGGAQTFGGGN